MPKSPASPRAAVPPPDVQRALVGLFQAGRFADLAAEAARHVGRWPDFAFGWKALGVARQMLRQDPLPALQRAAELLPGDGETLANLGNALREAGRLPEALIALEQSVALQPHQPVFLINLANVLRELGRRLDAVAVLRRAIAANPLLPEAHNNLGHTLFGLPGALDAALAAYREALRLRPDFLAAADNLLFALNYADGSAPSAMRAAAEAYGMVVAARAQPFRHWPNAPDPARRLRIGLLSGDLRRHPVGYLLQDVLPALDASAVELVAYVTQAAEDEVAAALRRAIPLWRPVGALPDAELAAQIRADGIDILVDLAGHTAHNRLPVFAWKPAPVQVAWLGYFATTGVAAIDYILGDPRVLPPEEAELFTEQPWRLPETYYCFAPPAGAPPLTPLPAQARGHLTFGYFGNLAKLAPAVLDCWASILQRLPAARLLIKSGGLDEVAVRESLLGEFARRGVAAARLELRGSTAREAHLAALAEADVALDSFPFPGGMTTLEALWMGVPTLTLAGDRFIGHQGETLLAAAGLEAWIAADRAAYIECAVALASQLPALATLRGGLREQLRGSPLCAAPRFAGHLQAAWRDMWRRWCAQQR